MRAKIEIEIEDDSLSEADLRSALLERLFNYAYGWVNGDLIPEITFIYNDDEDEIRSLKDMPYFNSNDNDLVN